MNDYKYAIKRLRTLAPEICDAVQAHTTQLRQQIEAERSARAQIVSRTIPVSVPTVATSGNNEKHLQLRIKHLERQVDRMQHKLDEARQIRVLRDAVEVHVERLKASLATVVALNSLGVVGMDMEVLCPLTVLVESSLLSKEIKVSQSMAVKTLARMAFLPNEQQRVIGATLNAISQYGLDSYFQSGVGHE